MSSSDTFVSSPLTSPPKDDPRLAAEVEITVPFHDVDPMEVVWHGHYFRYLELAREKLLSQLGYGYKEMREHGHVWPIIDARIKYPGPLRFGQKVRVVARLVEYHNRIKIAYTLFDAESGQRTTNALTIQVAVDAATGDLQFVSPDILFEKTGLPR